MQLANGLVLSDVRKAFRTLVAVDDLSMVVPTGSMFGLLGANGAGKTTTLRMILNILAPDQGTITWKGTPVTAVSRTAFGYLPEERGLYPKMRVGDQLVFLARLNNVPGPEASRRAREWLGRVGLGDAWSRKVEELSKGNQQKVQVLAAILHEPDLMLLDEPFSGLDPINTDVLRDTLFRRRAEGHTIIFSSHRLEQVEELCDHVAIIHRGRLLKSGPLSEVKRNTGRQLVEIAFDMPEHNNGTSNVNSNGNRDGRGSLIAQFVASLAPYGVHMLEQRANGARLELLNGNSGEVVIHKALDSGIGPVRRFELVEPSLQEVFLRAVRDVDPSAVEQADVATLTSLQPVGAAISEVNDER